MQCRNRWRCYAGIHMQVLYEQTHWRQAKNITTTTGKPLFDCTKQNWQAANKQTLHCTSRHEETATSMNSKLPARRAGEGKKENYPCWDSSKRQGWWTNWTDPAPGKEGRKARVKDVVTVISLSKKTSRRPESGRCRLLTFTRTLEAWSSFVFHHRTYQQPIN